jgi:hypothetical protein
MGTFGFLPVKMGFVYLKALIYIWRKLQCKNKVMKRVEKIEPFYPQIQGCSPQIRGVAKWPNLGLCGWMIRSNIAAWFFNLMIWRKPIFTNLAF